MSNRIEEDVKKYSLASISTNSLYNVAYLIIHTILMLISTPIIINALGVDTYGLWVMALSLIGFLGIVDFGLGTAVTKFLAEYDAEGKLSSSAEVLTPVLLFDIVLGIIISIMVFLLASIIANTFDVSEELTLTSIQIFRIASIGIVAHLLQNVFLGIPMAVLRYDLYNILKIFYRVLASSGAILVAVYFREGKAVISWSVISTWIALMVNIAVAVKLVGPKLLKFKWNRAKVKQIFRFSGFVALSSLGSVIFMYGDRLLIGAILGPASVAYYAIAVGLASKINQLASALANIFTPVTSSLQAFKEKKLLYHLLLRGTRLTSIIILCAGAVSFIMSDIILKLWLGSQLTVELSIITRLLIVAYSIISLSAVASFTINGLGKPEITATIRLVASIATIMCIAILSPIYELFGAAIANFVFSINFLSAFYIPYYFNRPVLSETWSMFNGALLIFCLSIGLSLILPHNNLLAIFLSSLTIIGYLMLILLYEPILRHRLREREFF